MNEDNVKKLIDFTLEITNGCQFSCTGCTVDMEGNSWPTDNDWNKISDLIVYFFNTSQLQSKSDLEAITNFN